MGNQHQFRDATSAEKRDADRPELENRTHTRRISTHATEPAEPLVSSTFRLHTCTPFGVLHKSPQKSASHEPRVAPIETQMLSLWKLRVGAEDYYLEQVAKGLDDYYSGAGETRGEWLGAASTALGLEHAVSAAELRAVLAGLAPGTGLTPNGDQIRTFKNRVPGFDLTFSAPKSVSVLYALADPLVRAQVTEATDTAVNEALGWLEREACFVRRGSNKRTAKTPQFEKWGTRRLPGNGFIAAQFRHRTSRHGDPQLHSHVLIANMTQGPDGKWSALDGQALYRSKIAAGTVYQSVLRNELASRLGVEWGAQRNGLADIVGVPKKLTRIFSKRRIEIETELARTGQTGPKAADTAALDTRHAKINIEQDTLDGRWHDEARLAGFGPGTIDTLLAGTNPDSQDFAANAANTPLASDSMIAVQRYDAYTRVVVHETLTIDEFAQRIGTALPATDAIVNRHDVQNTVAAQLGASGSTRLLERLTDAVLAHPELIPLPIEDHQDAAWEQRWTTRTLIDREAELTAMFTPTPLGVGLADSRLVESYLTAANTTLGPDQADALRRLTTQGLGVEAVVGKAGTGKTYVMNAVREVFEAGGYAVYGACPTGRAARELSEGAGINAATIHKMFIDKTPDFLDQHAVVVLDEAGMIGTFDFHEVIAKCRQAGAKVIVVGDHHQLPEIEAGGGFAALLDAVGDFKCELTINRRQRHEWEHPALDHLRNGDINAFWAAYLEHDRVRLGNNHQAVQTLAVTDWFGAYMSGSNAHMLAGTRAESALLNDIARALIATTGRLTGRTLDVNGYDFQVGDRILMTRNDWGHTDLDTGAKTGVDNGMLGDIIEIRHRTSEVDVRLASGRRIRLNGGYIRDGHIAHGYATTFHKAQGLTCDDVFVVGPHGMYRESGYVALSRAKNEAHLYATAKEAAAIGEQAHTTGIRLPTEPLTDAATDIVNTLKSSHAKHFATAHAPHLAVITDIAHTFTIGELERRLHHINIVAANLRANGHTDPTAAVEQLTQATLHRSRMRTGGRVKALDWDNVGTITNLVDPVGAAVVEFTTSDGTRTHTKTLQWHQIRPIDHPELADMTPEALTYLGELDQVLTGELHNWTRALAEHDIELHEFELFPKALEQRRRQLLHQYRATPPDWLRFWAGNRPSDPIGANVYDEHIEPLTQWRDTHKLDDDTIGYGPQPADPDLAQQWRTLIDDALNTRIWLAHHQPQLAQQTPDPIDLLDARHRIEELETIFATAPADMTRILDDLTAGQTQLNEAERLEALTAVCTSCEH